MSSGTSGAQLESRQHEVTLWVRASLRRYIAFYGNIYTQSSWRVSRGAHAGCEVQSGHELMNVPAIFSVFRVIRKPALCLPHHTVPTFADIPVPIESAFTSTRSKAINIRAVVLDKDNCFAVPDQDAVDPSCEVCTALACSEFEYKYITGPIRRVC